MHTTHTNFSIKYSFPIGMIVILNQSAFEFSQLKLMQWLQEIFKKKFLFHLENELHALFKYRI